MSSALQLWEGRVVAEGKFPLRICVGESDHSAVFETFGPVISPDSGKAAIKLIPTTANQADQQLLRWEAASELDHPNLIRILEAGRCELDDLQLLYVVEEFAEENLSQVLPERALTPEEVQGMLPAILRALLYLHGKGLVHAHLEPSNVMAIGDQVKLSSDSLIAPGENGRHERAPGAYNPPEAETGPLSTASDVWQLGVLLTEALTQRAPVSDPQHPTPAALPDGIPQPLVEIIENSLRVDPDRRWTVAQILSRLEGKRPDVPSPQPSRRSHQETLGSEWMRRLSQVRGTG
ncbi:MAG: protein kinase [Terriglobales bacterium]